MHFPNKKNSPFTKYRDMRETNKTRHKAFSVTNIEVNCRRISAGTAVEAKTGGGRDSPQQSITPGATRFFPKTIYSTNST